MITSAFDETLAAAASAPTHVPIAPHLRRVNIVDVPSPLLLCQDGGEPLRLYIHPDVPMRNHVLSQLHPSCISPLPLSATHILLDLLPPRPTSNASPTPEQRGFIEHRGPRKVLCGYWAQECLRIGGVADMEFWDLNGWELRRGGGGSSSSIAEGVEVEQTDVTEDTGSDVQGVVDNPIQLESQDTQDMLPHRSESASCAVLSSLPTTLVRANASPARSTEGGTEPVSIGLGDSDGSGADQRGRRRTTTPLPNARGVRNKGKQSQPLSTVSPPPTPSATPSSAPSESLASPSPDPPEVSPSRRSKRARPRPTVGDDDPAASTSQRAKRTRGLRPSSVANFASTPTASSSTSRRQHGSDSRPGSTSRPHSHSQSSHPSNSFHPSHPSRPSRPSRPSLPLDSVSPRHTQLELDPTARQTSSQSGRSRFQWPKRSLRPAEGLQAMWDYFLASAYSQLGLPVPPNTGPGQVDTVQRGMVDRVHGMWVEARTKYTRRNLDHMSIMLSTWTTAREFHLSARALRRYYDANKHRIIDDKGPYVPSDRRPSDWPFHDHDPENIEAKAWWIYDWGTKKCALFLGVEGDDEVPNGRSRREGSVGEAAALESDHEDTLESDEDEGESDGEETKAEPRAETEARVARIEEESEGNVAEDVEPTHSDKRQARKRKRAVPRVRSQARREVMSKVKLEEDVDSLEGFDSD